MISDINIRVDRDRCIACGICVDRCIMDNLRLSVPPCRQTCPLHMNCQGYVRLIAQGKYPEAMEVLKPYHPFIHILARICRHPCEAVCERGKIDDPVHIRALKRYLAEEFPQPCAFPAVQTESGRRAAIVGSGPAGLMAAYSLRSLGHAVTVYEAEPEPGGLMRYAIPSFRLPVGQVEQAVDALTGIGVEIKTGTPVEMGEGIRELESMFDAVLLAVGAGAPVRPETPGIDHENVILAMGRQKAPKGLPGDLLGPADGRPAADPLTLQTLSRPKVFVCGDFHTGPSSVVHALASGKEAAVSVARFLRGEALRWGRGFENDGWVKEYMPLPERARGGHRGKLIRIPADAAKPETDVEQVFSPEEARREAERCMSCGRSFEMNRTCWSCLPCEIECPTEALEVRIPYLVR